MSKQRAPEPTHRYLMAALNDLYNAVEDDCRRSLGALPEIYCIHYNWLEIDHRRLGQRVVITTIQVYDSSLRERIA